MKNIYEIAKIAGVSTTTVSRVINAKEGVGEDTRRMILNIIEEADFKPRITNNKNNNIGVFLGSDFGTERLYSPYIMKILDGLGSVFFTYDFNMLVIPTNKIPKDKYGFKVYCHKRNVCASVFTNITINEDFVNEFGDIMPTATIGTTFDSPYIYSVRSNNYKGAYDAIDYMIKSGHKNIVFFIPDLNRQDCLDRVEGFKNAMTDNGLNYDQHRNILQVSSYSQTGIKILLEKIMSTENRPTAFFVVNDVEVIRLSSIFCELGYSIPEDVSIIGYDDYDYSEHFLPPLITVRQPVFEMGKRTALLFPGIPPVPL
ncbi:LacI family transcriptional regulator [Candidatus Nomurabacteria bacterium]|nr:LacI family transcriptional regulator [Candidatus Nomurabacteria bacterium]